jgi:hypothetical protein
MKSSERDVKIAVFYSPHLAGDVKVKYCRHRQMLVLEYHTKDGVMAHDYDVTKPSEVRDMVLDAIGIAGESVGGRV